MMPPGGRGGGGGGFRGRDGMGNSINSNNSLSSSSSIPLPLLTSSSGSSPSNDPFVQQSFPAPTCFDILPFPSIKCKVHPVVLMTILDSFVRKEENQQIVIGTLLGIMTEGNILEVTDCFVDRHSLTEEGLLQIMKDHHESMFDLKQQVNPKEHVVGWFCTGSVMTELTCAVHGWFKAVNSVSKFMPQPPLSEPIHLMVDVSRETGSLAVHAFMQVPLTIVKEATFQFHEIPLQIYSSAADRNAIRVLLKSRSSSNNNNDSKQSREDATNLLSKSGFEESLERLLELLGKCTAYVNNVLENKETPDVEIGRYLSKALCSDVLQSTEQFEQLCQSSLQDGLMVAYLATLSRVQFALAERLNTSFF